MVQDRGIQAVSMDREHKLAFPAGADIDVT
jgi:hypothetical protein